MSVRGANPPAYRPYFQVLTDLLLSAGDHLAATFETFASSLLQKADLAVNRHQAADADFLYSIFKLFHRIGSASDLGHKIVAKHRELWKKIRMKFSSIKRVGPPQAATATTTTAHPTTTAAAADNQINQQKQEDIQLLNKYSLDD
jgi:hypothetical protein